MEFRKIPSSRLSRTFFEGLTDEPAAATCLPTIRLCLATALSWCKTKTIFAFYFLKSSPRPLFADFCLFNRTNSCEKCPCSIRRQDSNSQPLDCESSPLTTRPGLSPFARIALLSHSRLTSL